MAWHTEDWMNFVFKFLVWLAKVVFEAQQWEDNNGGGVLRDTEKNAQK